MTVLSPVKITIPLPLPSVHYVPKNVKFFVSNGLFGCEHSVDLRSNTVSPVRLELSTFISLLSKILQSAGTRFPAEI